MPENTSKTGTSIGQAPGPKYLSDHLANERTYLAYLRTAVSLMSFGIAINRFSLFLEQSGGEPRAARLGSSLVGSEQLGLGMVIVGMTLLVWAAVHYTLILREIEMQDFRPRPLGVLILTVLVLISGVGGVVWLFVT